MKPEFVNRIREAFVARFKQDPWIFRSPGRVNIIGEHTDYNEGFVLPAAIDKAIYVAISKRDDNMVSLYSVEFQQEFSASLDSLQPVKEVWPNYVLGVAAQFQKRGYKLSGFNLVFDGDVPIGSGLSSSAAVECATAIALNEIFELRVGKMDLAFIGQKAEHEFAGVMCGIMDQFASVFGKRDHAMKLDCRTMEFEYLPIEMKGHKIVLLNTNVRHSLASSEYNTRRQQCEAGVEMVRKFEPGVKSLRDVTLEMLEKYVKKDELVFRRCHYVVSENQRLLEAAECMKRSDLPGLGKLMYASHEGLSREYDVSCKELDFLVESVRQEEGVMGARMMGGGFGGCTINIIRDDRIGALIEKLKPAYARAMNLELTPYIAETANGSERIV